MTTGRLPDFLIVGAARSGTTSLAYWLSRHPGVFVAARKEVFYFDREERYAHGDEWYAAHFADAAPGQVAGEASTSYLYYPHVPERMARLVPDARLVALLRHPVDRAYSHYCFARTWGTEPREFADAVRDELVGERPSGREYLDRGLYVDQLERLCRYYPRDALFVALFDDVSTRPTETFRAVCRFIGADDAVVPAEVGEAVNASRRIRYRPLFDALRRWRSWSRSPGTLSARIDKLNAASYPPLDADLRAGLLDHYAEPNRRLAEWLARPLTGWDR